MSALVAVGLQYVVAIVTSPILMSKAWYFSFDNLKDVV